MGEPAPQLAQPADVETAPKPVPLILLVDDDEITRIGMAGRLKRLGYRVIEAVDGSAGLAAIRVHRPDLDNSISRPTARRAWLSGSAIATGSAKVKSSATQLPLYGLLSKRLIR